MIIQCGTAHDAGRSGDGVYGVDQLRRGVNDAPRAGVVQLVMAAKSPEHAQRMSPYVQGGLDIPCRDHRSSLH